MGCYGYQRNTTPYLSSHIDEWLRFDAHYSVSAYSGPAYASIVSGLWPWRHGTLHWEDVRYPTMIEMFKGAGYRTSYIGQVDPPFFAPFIGKFHEKRVGPPWEMTKWILDIVRNHKHGEEPHFIYALYIPCHMPYCFGTTPFAERPEGYRLVPDFASGKIRQMDFRFTFKESFSDADLEYTAALYDKQVLEMDRYLEQIMGALAETGLLNKSLVIFTSDHGESLGEDGVYFWHGFSMRNSNIRVPLLVYRTGKTGAIPFTTRHIDLLPTLANQIGVQLPYRPDGVDLHLVKEDLPAIALGNYFT
ncbi:MAG: sulfatase-like hydrolase/transferase, partial [Candidatus Lindowbacteria bacterium]|nr:sulfatase-like hydrolase/transferase [Candidatus Lindowbacteria bacterium]